MQSLQIEKLKFSISFFFFLQTTISLTFLIRYTRFLRVDLSYMNFLICNIFHLRISNIHLLTGYEGNSTFIVPKVSTIFQGNPEYQVYKCFIILNNCAIQDSKLGPFLMDF
jgi:hypothetical protein